MNALLSFAPLFGRLRGSLAVALILSLVTLVAGIALLGLSGWFLTAAALTTAGAAFNLFSPSAGVRALSFIRILSRYGEKLTGHNATLKLLSDLRQWVFARLFPVVPLGRRFGRADLVSRLIADIDALDTVFLLALGPITTAILAGVAMTLGLGMLLPGAAPWYGAAFLAAVVIVPTGLVLLSREAGAAALEASAKLRGLVMDGLDGHQDLVVFGGLRRVAAEAEAATSALSAARRRLGVLGALAAGATQLFAGLAITGTLLAGLAALADGAIDGPLFAGILLAVVASFEASAMLVRSATRLAGAAAAARRLKTIADVEPAVRDVANPAMLPQGGHVTFAGVNFGYDAQRPILHDLSFAIPPGSLVAIAGPSGSGKSTIAHLLLRLADPQEGVVAINGVDLRTVRSAALRRTVALMTQDAPVFLDTIRNNLAIGDPEATEPQLWEVLEAVGLGAFVAALPDGLDALVGEAGRTLSVGQARRLCLARSLLSPAGVLVLDEPTTGLDGEAEAAFLTDLRKIAGRRTVIVITHAPLPAGAFDRVLRLRAGRITD